MVHGGHSSGTRDHWVRGCVRVCDEEEEGDRERERENFNVFLFLVRHV